MADHPAGSSICRFIQGLFRIICLFLQVILMKKVNSLLHETKKIKNLVKTFIDLSVLICHILFVKHRRDVKNINKG